MCIIRALNAKTDRQVSIRLIWARLQGCHLNDFSLQTKVATTIATLAWDRGKPNLSSHTVVLSMYFYMAKSRLRCAIPPPWISLYLLVSSGSYLIRLLLITVLVLFITNTPAGERKSSREETPAIWATSATDSAWCDIGALGGWSEGTE